MAGLVLLSARPRPSLQDHLVLSGDKRGQIAVWDHQKVTPQRGLRKPWLPVNMPGYWLCCMAQHRLWLHPAPLRGCLTHKTAAVALSPPSQSIPHLPTHPVSPHHPALTPHSGV
jgi:hypothetical protein